LPGLLINDSRTNWLTLDQLARRVGLIQEVVLLLVSTLKAKGRSEDIGLHIVVGRSAVNGLYREKRQPGKVPQRFYSVELVRILTEYLKTSSALEKEMRRVKKPNVTDWSKVLDNLLAEEPDIVAQCDAWKRRLYLQVRDSANTFPSWPGLMQLESALETGVEEQNQTSKFFEWSEDKPLPDEAIWSGKVRPKPGVLPGSRVIVAKNSGLVRFGTFGTVIGVLADPNVVVVLTDEEAKWGSTLAGRIKTPRAFTLNVTDLAKLT
jgi:hypothetical protein